ncbi:hypothetical protein SCHPADRAFT_577516 [Schizopora paradoxa]|uniref:Uncharacterized protein n=1 Tax=Schizopora paradoxa TaxID=27342 RepID=A0A0H2RBJ1_9AGAM|nr:hypothetical protein SCHPADRAFT_577516 [Schizopora paradoxa]
MKILSGVSYYKTLNRFPPRNLVPYDAVNSAEVLSFKKIPPKQRHHSRRDYSECTNRKSYSQKPNAPFRFYHRRQNIYNNPTILDLTKIVSFAVKEKRRRNIYLNYEHIDSAHATNNPFDLNIGRAEDRSHTTPGGGHHWHIGILMQKSGRACGEGLRLGLARSVLWPCNVAMSDSGRQSDAKKNLQSSETSPQCASCSPCEA